ncbi:MAG: hypothetical protein MJZ06_01435 [Bacteroidaceae bacterium]|nr:hypothetical protein [Bacteroidaceae bacterium]
MKLTDNRFLTGKGFGVHSPWAYDLIEFVINEKWPYYAYDDLYPFWQKAPDWLPQYPQSRDELMFRLVNRFNPAFILEVGTGAGVTTGYLASVNSKSNVVTIDNRHSSNKDVARNLKKIKNIAYLTGNVMETLQDVIADTPRIDFVHVAHTPDFREVVEQLLPVMGQDSVMVIQDMGKKEKKEWWKQLIEDPRIGVTFQLSKLGILFFDHTKTKQHYVL